MPSIKSLIVVVGRYSASGFCFAGAALNRKESKVEHSSNVAGVLFTGKSETCFRQNSKLRIAMLMTGLLIASEPSFGPGRWRAFIRGHIDGKDKTLAVAADRAEAARHRPRQSEKHLWRADTERRCGLHISCHHHEVV
jgi:hypothetical protein